MNSTLYLTTQIGFVATTLIFYSLVIFQLKKALSISNFAIGEQRNIIKRVIVALLLWMVVLSGLSLSGFFLNFDTIPPRFVVIIAIPLVTLIWALLISKTTKQILQLVPAQAIINLQVFRVIVEILLWMLFIQNLLPIQMTFEGLNFDILAGITAPLIAYFGIVKNKWPSRLIIVWNMVSLGLLLNIVIIAILSFPTTFRYFMNEPANAIVATFPFVWLPGFLVPLAYGLHFLSIRKHLNQKD